MKWKIVHTALESETLGGGGKRVEDLAGQHLLPPQPLTTICVARTEEELKTAYALVHAQYVKQGYQAEDPKGVRFTPHFGLPTSHTLVASIGDDVVGTLTIVGDGVLGLPIEKEYPYEIKALRERGARLAEVSCLVSRRSRDLPVLLQLLYAAYTYALHHLEVTDFCVAVTTEHQHFYKRALLFKQIGPVKPYASCKGVSAVAMRLHLPSAEQRYLNTHTMRKMLGRFFLGKKGLQELGEHLKTPDRDALDTRLAFTRTYLDWPNLDAATVKSIEDAYAEAFHNPAGIKVTSPSPAAGSKAEHRTLLWRFLFRRPRR